MIRIFILAVATAATVLLFLGLARSERYRSLFENLDEGEHPFKAFLGIGFALAAMRPFRLRGNLERDLKKQSKLYWDNDYYEYYALLTWAEFLTYAVLILAAGLALAGLVGGESTLFLAIIVILFLMAAWNLTISKMREAVDKRRQECDYEFPNMVSKLALLINSGMILRQAWQTVAYGKKGALYDLMQRSCVEMDNGVSEMNALHHFGVLADSTEIKKFTSSMIQGMEKGSSDLASYLLGQTSELWNRKRQLALQRGEIAAGKLIIPLALMFGGIILIIISAAMQSLSF